MAGCLAGVKRFFVLCYRQMREVAAVLSFPTQYDFAQAATLPTAALTAWSALVTEGHIIPGQTTIVTSPCPC
jgi:NADPH:quinone reductase-like Zn-dependent oxidoreductase